MSALHDWLIIQSITLLHISLCLASLLPIITSLGWTSQKQVLVFSQACTAWDQTLRAGCGYFTKFLPMRNEQKWDVQTLSQALENNWLYMSLPAVFLSLSITPFPTDWKTATTGTILEATNQRWLSCHASTRLLIAGLLSEGKVNLYIENEHGTPAKTNNNKILSALCWRYLLESSLPLNYPKHLDWTNGTTLI